MDWKKSDRIGNRSQRSGCGGVATVSTCGGNDV